MGVVVKREILVLVCLLFAIMSICGSCRGVVYNVGDSAGWTIISNMDYNQWSSSKTFHVGDTLIFEYDQMFHNVVEVSRSDFHTCNAEAPIATYTSGNDSVVIRGPGHYFYICGFVGHCEAGQKVDIRVPKSSGPTVGPVQAPSGPTSPNVSPIGPMAPSPSQSSGESLNNWLWSNCNLGVLLILCLEFQFKLMGVFY